MNLRQLKIFVMVCKTKNMSKAAKKLYMSQPAISQTISELEEDLNIKLFDRIKKRLKLTYAGKILLRNSKRILNLVDETENIIKDIVNMNQGKLRIGASMTIGTYLLPQIIEGFLNKYNKIHLPFTIDNTKVIEDMILDNKLDLALVEGPIYCKDILVEHFFDDQLYLMCSSKHSWSHKRKINSEELKGEDFIIREKGSGTRETIENIMRKHSIKYHVTHVFNNIEAIKRAIISNLGVSILPEICVKEELKKGLLVKVDIQGIEFKRKFSIIYHKDKYRSQLFNNFVNHIYTNICKS
ncbi:LysR family transcriptional regulator [Halothermothrix orenii]|uniref:Transcriptional regulator, LysR family n=1 Tax=Halothermothrix orenii (strain H 168 / OCM 544 / DSM 9562) TaxID=373903 RepID=B8D275_HALOH|nr:LysR family transcriptional regulator [Halothermothrix orenii]ACL69302.1 transcriptional regulator, LysR family [Halothermothrix orenii H 168]